MEPESLLEAVADFEKKSKKEASSLLDQFLCHVAKTGETLIPWSQFKSYFVFKLEKVMDDFRTSAPEPRAPPNPNVEYVPYEEMKNRILKIVNGFTGIPFTIQRLCELLTDPKKNYTGTDKFLRGVEKNVMVVSCVYPSTDITFGSNSLNRVNGIMLSGSHTSYTDRSNINGPGTPRPLSRSKVLLSSSLTTNGLPDSFDREINVQPTEDKSHSDSPTSHGEDIQSNCSKNKHLEDTMEAEAPEVKRLKFDTENEEEEEPEHSESSSEMPEETENTEKQEEAKDESEWTDPVDADKQEPSSIQVKAMFESEQDKDEVSSDNVKTSDENQMDQSEPTKTLTSKASEISENTDAVSNSVDYSDTEKTDTPPETPEMPSESPMENSADATEEPMEQD
ncbi:serine/threonine-protein phosphatase 4 regulatory subunit 2-A [Scyliorhinus torazame]|uniref:serine/threonine-protein phosphatase 4 regulatory subunit 2-A n=1 Tax=Scyliorhinus torazame TaxID=75743 RepID=UPI003B59D97B